MAEVNETTLPGVGVRYEFTTDAGERVAVVTHRTGRRELAVYDRDDPDACRMLVHLSAGDTRTLGEILGASHVSETVAAVQQRLEGLAIDWVTIPATSPAIGSTIGEGAFRTRTGASVVAVVRGATTIPAPGPDHRFEAGDVAVAVGTPDGLAQLRALLVS
ncbi:MAG TPA: cation:proton antiporter regulatory subunit [Acidimicrobiales bacterium]|nr:cation:proton antiporter regulatory subunit [Acidimicrobiales bacterium]